MKRDLLSQSLAKVKAASNEPPAPATSSPGPIRTVSSVAESLKRLSANAVQEIPTERIRGSRFSDRMDIKEGLEDLVVSLQESGQQVPVLLRRIPSDIDQFEVVYGRRRIEACRRLEIPVRALIVDFDEEQAIIAQGLENAARKDTTFIERALFAAQVEGSGMPHEAILRALGIDKTSLSRMRRVVTRIPEAIIRAIGPAPGKGRRPWSELADAVEGFPEEDLARHVRLDLPSDERLDHLMSSLQKPTIKAPSEETHVTEVLHGRAQMSRRGGVIRIRLLGAGSGVIASELEERIAGLIREHLSEHNQVAQGQPGTETDPENKEGG